MKGKEMKFAKLLSVMLLGIMLVSSVSFGQAIPSGTARFEALGSSPFILDAAIDMNNNPAWSTEFKHYAFGDIGRNVVNSNQLTGQYAGVNFGVSKQVSLGLVANKTESMWDEFNVFNQRYVSDSLLISAPIVPLKVLFGWQASPNFSLGIAPYYAAWSYEQTQSSAGTTLKKSSSTFGGTVGVIGKLDKGSFVEGAVDVKTNKYSYEFSGPSVSQTIDNSGGMQLNVFTRGFFVVNKALNMKLVPYLGLGIYSFDPKNTAVTTTMNNYSYFDFAGGIGLNMPILDDGLFAGGISVSYHKWQDKLDGSYTSTYSEFRLPKINLGMEWNFTNWLQGRVGYSRAVVSSDSKFETTTNTTEVKNAFASDADQTITTGLGFQFNRFSLDGTVGEKFWKQAPWLVSGNANELFGVLSASYYFGR